MNLDVNAQELRGPAFAARRRAGAVVAQVESAIAIGLGAPLHGKLEIREGRVQQSNLHDYRVLSLDEMPLRIGA